MLLTDSQQLKLLDELSPTTQTRIEVALKKYGIDKVPKEIETLRAENRQLHAQTQGKISSFVKSWANIFSHGKSEFDRQ